MPALSSETRLRPGLLSIVIPLRDDARTILPLLREIDEVLSDAEAYEVICVDDKSADETRSLLAGAQRFNPRLRCYGHAEPQGQSAALHSGVRLARGDLVLTLDGDGRSEPADIPILLNAFLAAQRVAPVSRMSLAMIAGTGRAGPVAAFARLASRAARAFSRTRLRDRGWGTGVGLNLFVREAYLDLPYAAETHRSLPDLMRRRGYSVVQMPVASRRRRRARSGCGALLGGRHLDSVPSLGQPASR